MREFRRDLIPPCGGLNPPAPANGQAYSQGCADYVTACVAFDFPLRNGFMKKDHLARLKAQGIEAID
jgi:hypothetical protein